MRFMNRLQGGNSADVTAALAAHLKDNTLSIVVNNENLGGDPSLNKRKHLRVEYELGGVPGTAVIDENETLSIPEQTVSSPPYLRKSFELKGPVKRAILYATALGLYETHINGQRVGDHILAPDWTDYRHRVRYQAYDVRPLLKKNHNAIGALLGNGWYCGHIGNGGFRFFGNEPEYLAQLEITYADGATEQIGTDTSWKWHRSPILASDFMLGEDYDARLEIAGWDKPGLDDSQWTPATVSPETGCCLKRKSWSPFAMSAPSRLNPSGPTHRDAGFMTLAKTWSAWSGWRWRRPLEQKSRCATPRCSIPTERSTPKICAAARPWTNMSAKASVRKSGSPASLFMVSVTWKSPA